MNTLVIVLAVAAVVVAAILLSRRRGGRQVGFGNDAPQRPPSGGSGGAGHARPAPSSSAPTMRPPRTGAAREVAADSPWSIEVQDQIDAFLDAGQKIEAIKVARLNTGLDLKGAKEAVEKYDQSRG